MDDLRRRALTRPPPSGNDPRSHFDGNRQEDQSLPVNRAHRSTSGHAHTSAPVSSVTGVGKSSKRRAPRLKDARIGEAESRDDFCDANELIHVDPSAHAYEGLPGSRSL